MKINNIELKNNVIVGPMAGISNKAFRILFKEFGAGLIYTEMISDKAIVYQNQKTLQMVDIDDNEYPIALQLFGSEVKTMVEAAIYIEKYSKANILDINMGCPVKKVVNTGAGSKLMTTPDLAYDIVTNIIKNINLPVTVKIRSGYDAINAVEFAKMLESAGVSAIAVHGRTRNQMYEGKADWNIIKEVKDNVSIPVIGNGDIKSANDAGLIQEQTNCDGIMIARGCLGNPWLIHQIINNSSNELIDYQTKLNLCLKHALALIELKNEKIAIKEMRTHTAWYIKGLPHAVQIKQQLNTINTYNELKDLITNYSLLIGDLEKNNSSLK